MTGGIGFAFGGSSPRMRGALAELSIARGIAGIIPADAGSTSPGHVKGLHTTDHPRGCGEHSFIGKSERITIGSSPRMRGAPGLGRKVSSLLGIIPADAGSTTSWAVCTT